ncbi:MAG: SGNH/GDSL hydrolase family protein [Ruminococcaceae bacterium]|nr:SGNH/GDSL hydrolase family protein [Oscillospiraceae bacterium]
MQLTIDQIKTLTFGAVQAEETKDGLRFYKCTEKQIEAWKTLSATLGERAETTPGVRLDFHTDSKSFSFEAVGVFEVYINDLFRTKLDLSEGGHATVALCDPLGDPLEDARVTLIFPSHYLNASLKSVSVDDGAYVKPHEFDRKILFVGDSITQGWDSGYDSLSYAWRVMRFFNADAVIHGVGGGYFHRTVFDSIEFDPDIVILALGTNDFGKYPTTAAMREETVAFMDRLAAEYQGKKIFCISPTWRMGQEKPMGHFRDCRQVVIDEATKRGFIHINGLDLVPPDPAFFADPKPLHPNALGFGIYAENLIRKMLKYL